MQKPWAWERIAGTVLGLALAGNAAVYAMVVQPLAEAERGQQQRLLALQGKIRALQGEARALEAQLKALQEVQAYREKLPERRGLVRVTRDLAQIADTLALKMPGITYQPEALKDADLLRVKLTLAVEGRYEQVRLFLHEVEKRRQHLVVERMGLTEQRGPAQAGQVAMQLSLAGYFR